MKRYISRLFLAICVLSTIESVAHSNAFALDPMFELNTKQLGHHDQVRSQLMEPVSNAQSDPAIVAKPQSLHTVSKTPERRHSDDSEKSSTASHPGNDFPTVVVAKPSSSRKKPDSASRPKESRGVKSERVAKTIPQGKPVKTVNLSPVGTAEIQWAQDLWARIDQSSRQESGPLVVQGRNFSLSLDPKRYPIMPAADGGKIVVDSRMSLSPLVKTLLHEKDSGIRVVEGNTASRTAFFSSLLAAARFYSVEENFSVDFGSDPKLTVTSDFKIEKTSASLLENDVVLVNVTNKSEGMPPQLLSFLGKEGFRTIDSSQPYAVRADGRKVLYSIAGSRRETLVDDLSVALGIPCDKNKDLQLDDGALSGVKLSVMADRYMERNNDKIVISFFEENPVQYTLLRLLELKGYQVVILKPDDGFRVITEKVFSSLGLPAHYGMQPLWVEDETPFRVQLSGFVMAESGRTGMRTVLTNVPIDPLVGELARYKGFDVVVK